MLEYPTVVDLEKHKMQCISPVRLAAPDVGVNTLSDCQGSDANRAACNN